MGPLRPYRVAVASPSLPYAYSNSPRSPGPGYVNSHPTHPIYPPILHPGAVGAPAPLPDSVTVTHRDVLVSPRDPSVALVAGAGSHRGGTTGLSTSRGGRSTRGSLYYLEGTGRVVGGGFTQMGGGGGSTATGAGAVTPTPTLGSGTRHPSPRTFRSIDRRRDGHGPPGGSVGSTATGETGTLGKAATRTGTAPSLPHPHHSRGKTPHTAPLQPSPGPARGLGGTVASPPGGPGETYRKSVETVPAANAAPSEFAVPLVPLLPALRGGLCYAGGGDPHVEETWRKEGGSPERARHRAPVGGPDRIDAR